MKYFSWYLITVIVIVLLPSALSEKSEILVVLKHTANTFNEKYVAKLLTTRKPINRTTSLTGTDIHFKPEVELGSPLYVHIETLRKFATQYKPIMVRHRFEVCEALKLRNHPLFKFFYHKTNETDSNLMDPCPFKGHRYQKPYLTSYEHMPPLLPTGMWKQHITLTKGLEEKILTVMNYYEITAKGIIEF